MDPHKPHENPYRIDYLDEFSDYPEDQKPNKEEVEYSY